jgi:hypothetical protein
MVCGIDGDCMPMSGRNVQPTPDKAHRVGSVLQGLRHDAEEQVTQDKTEPFVGEVYEAQHLSKASDSDNQCSEAEATYCVGSVLQGLSARRRGAGAKKRCFY